MYEELWAGPELKQSYAHFHYQRMQMVFAYRDYSAHEVAMIVSGAVIDHGQQRNIYPHFDAFLSAARSIPEIIQCCFGHDQYRAMQQWFQQLPNDEQVRRDAFTAQFKSNYDAFRDLPLSRTRHTIEHRRGYAPVELTVITRFGVTYTGGPTRSVPVSETSPISNPQIPVMARSTPIELRPDDFTIEGRRLFVVCDEYMDAIGTLIRNARAIGDQVHGGRQLTPPPNA